MSAAKGRVQVGDFAPDFTLSDQSGGSFHFADVLGKKNVVLYFYPKDNTRGCTAEACSFRDNYADLQHADTEVIGVSGDSVDSHQQFASRYQLPFTLLSDSAGELRKLYGVPSTFGLLPGRVTYVIDCQGIVRHVFSSQFAAAKHVSEALKALESLTNPP